MPAAAHLSPFFENLVAFTWISKDEREVVLGVGSGAQHLGPKLNVFYSLF